MFPASTLGSLEVILWWLFVNFMFPVIFDGLSQEPVNDSSSWSLNPLVFRIKVGGFLFMVMLVDCVRFLLDYGLKKFKQMLLINLLYDISLLNRSRGRRSVTMVMTMIVAMLFGLRGIQRCSCLDMARAAMNLFGSFSIGIMIRLCSTLQTLPVIPTFLHQLLKFHFLLFHFDIGFHPCLPYSFFNLLLSHLLIL